MRLSFEETRGSTSLLSADMMPWPLMLSAGALLQAISHEHRFASRSMHRDVKLILFEPAKMQVTARESYSSDQRRISRQIGLPTLRAKPEAREGFTVDHRCTTFSAFLASRTLSFGHRAHIVVSCPHAATRST